VVVGCSAGTRHEISISWRCIAAALTGSRDRVRPTTRITSTTRRRRGRGRRGGGGGGGGGGGVLQGAATHASASAWVVVTGMATVSASSAVMARTAGLNIQALLVTDVSTRCIDE